MLNETLESQAPVKAAPLDKLLPNHDQVFHFTDLGFAKSTRAGDPYEYQPGFRNHFESEVLPGTLPIAQNHPQICRFNLYTEVLTASAFAAPRHTSSTTLLYRARPSCANGQYFAATQRRPCANISVRW